MAPPLAPILGIALKYGTVALATYATTRAIPLMRRNQSVEDTLDTVESGVSLRRDAEQANIAGRYTRMISLGRQGPRYLIDAVALTRIRIKKV